MKKILNIIMSFFESMGKARAAAELARAGHIDESKKLMAN